MTREEVKKKLLEVLDTWIETPEGTDQIVFKRAKGFIPNQGPTDVFVVRVESVALQLALPPDQPLVAPVTSMPSSLQKPNGG